MKQRLYLSGGMTGYPDFNYPTFNAAASELRAEGYDVFNPAESFNGDQSLDWTEYMKTDIAEILKCDAVVVLDGWQQSVGSRLEVMLALSIGLPILEMAYFPFAIFQGQKPRHAVEAMMNGTEKLAEDDEEAIFLEESILEEAQRLVHGNRGADYGHPYFDFRKTALMWTGLWIDKLKDGEVITPRDIPLAMNAVKMSREVNKPKRDNRVDGAGYWETLDMVDEMERRLT